MLILAAIIAGLFLTLREGIPWARALSSGVIHTRGARREAIRRTENPERFKAMTDRRFRAMGPGLICLAAASGWVIWTVGNNVRDAMWASAS